MSRIRTALKALRELGPRQVGLYLAYQAALRSGWLRQQTPAGGRYAAAGFSPEMVAAIFSPPASPVLKAVLGTRLSLLESEARLLLDGRLRLFGGKPAPLQLATGAELDHWTAYELGRRSWGVEDPKLIWEPARFGWAFALARLYHASGDERFPAAFWYYAEDFLEANPPNQGPHWASAQEVALRLIAFAFALQAFSRSPETTIPRASMLAKAIAEHAARIPPSLAYARAQNNNHLLTEAAGLYTAGMLLPEHPHAAQWRSLGWRWFNAGILSQVDPDGAYTQHSSNYHRLMLQTALWMGAMAGNSENSAFPEETARRLAAATRWLLALTDPETGRLPNLGPNDGAYILPLDSCPFSDYRPVLQAAGCAFLGEKPFPPGAWDEPLLWLNSPTAPAVQPDAARSPASTPHVLRSPDGASWAYLRVATFHGRPGHADQLHLDLWWRGINVAMDAGTYRYSAPPPWDNALMAAAVHNTLTVDGRDQMTRAGRFLYLDRAQAFLVARERDPAGEWERLVARHDGYLSLGVIHERAVSVLSDNRWQVADRLLPAHLDISPGTPEEQPGPTRAERLQSARLRTARLHWLLPDWPWELDGATLRLESPAGWILIAVQPEAHTPGLPVEVSLARAGELLAGPGPVEPVAGWVSPAYNQKVPALALIATATGRLPFSIQTTWQFPGEDG